MTHPTRRVAGLLVPLFSIPSSRSWGIGEIGDLPRLTAWMERSGLGLLQLLPTTEIAPGDTSPYGALSAMALDPQFISLSSVEDFAALGGEDALSSEDAAALGRARSAPAIDYHTVRRLKEQALRRACHRFIEREWDSGSARDNAFRAFRAREAWWLDDYALYRALRTAHGEIPWMRWPAPLRDRGPEALADARRDHAQEIRFRQYVQWLAADQWAAARAAAGRVALYGDLPFMVSGDSADVWSRQSEFRFDTSVGTPPDGFSATGQNWGLPPYRWDVVAAGDFEWLRRRARRMAELFDGCRVDHLVGFYRTYIRPLDGSDPYFSPAEEAEQVALGERVLGALRDAGLTLTAEDLGTVPDFVRESLARLEVPGYKVLRWERQWDVPGEPFRDPVDYPAVALATTGTHDNEPLAVWWPAAPDDEREAVLAIPSVARRLSAAESADARDTRAMTPALRGALLEALFASKAEVLVLPVQDVFGWTDRINEPGTVGAHNWRWRLPWPVDRLADQPEAEHVSGQLADWSGRHGRKPAPR